MLEKLIVKFHRLRFLLLFGINKYRESSIYGNFSIINPTKLKFGKNISINDYCYINATGGVCIGDNVSISSGAKIISVKLMYGSTTFQHEVGAIKIGNNVQVGAGSIILPSVNITDDVIIGAGCVVSKDIKESGVYVGIPAVRIK